MANINIYGTLVRPVESDKIVNGSQVEGGYFVCSALPSWGAKGQLCYCTDDSKFYQHNGTNWVDARLDGLATRIDALDFTYDDKDELKNKTYFVKTVAQEDGLVNITREQLPDIEISATTATAATLSNGGSFNVLTSIDEVEDTADTDNGHKIIKTARQFTLPTLGVSENITITTATGSITFGHKGALEGNDEVAPSVDAASTDAIQLKDTDGIKLPTIKFDTNGHKHSDSTIEYKLPKLTTWTWTDGTAAGPTAAITGIGTATIGVDAIPAATGTVSGIITTTTQTIGGAKTFNNDVTVETNANIKGTATINDLKVNTAAATNATITNATVINATITNATVTSATIEDAAITNITATNATIANATTTNLDSQFATINTLVSTTATITNLSSTNATIESATIDTAIIDNATIKNATITEETVEKANIDEAIINTVSATNGTIDSATITNLQVTTASVGTSNVGTANVATLNATTASVNQLTATNATLTNGFINTLSATNSTMENATITDATVTNTTIANATITSTALINNLSATAATITTLKVDGNSTFTGTVTISKDLVVEGTTTSVDFETAVTKENLIIANAEGGDIANRLSGLAIRVNSENTENAYGIVYDTGNEVIKLGLGTVNEDDGYEFTFKEGEDETIATREWVNDTSAPIAHASTATTYGVASTTHYGHVKSATALPSAHNATASVGSKTDVYAREDHIHPVSLITFNDAGNGATSGATYNTSAAVTISHNTIGAAQKNHASTTSDFGLSSTTNYGHAKASATIPKAHSATGSAGTVVTVFALEDHIHPVSALTIKFATATTNNTSATTTFNTSAAATVTIGPASIGVSPGATKVETSTVNGNIKIDNVEKTVYTHPTYTATAQAKVYNITVDSKGHVDSTSIADAGDLLMTGYTATAASIATTDSVLTAIGKLEQYVNDKNNALTTALQNYVDAIDALVGGN